MVQHTHTDALLLNARCCSVRGDRIRAAIAVQGMGAGCSGIGSGLRKLLRQYIAETDIGPP
jgi:hypothetical protein